MDHARKVVDDQIEVHTRAILDLKTRLNTLTPVARLPPELLSAIFAFVPAKSFTEHYNASEIVRPYRVNTWVTVAHVCRHWRAIALSSPRFWSYITVTSKRAADEMIARSKKAPLHIVGPVSPYRDGPRKVMEELMSEFSRIHTLRLAGRAQEIQDLFKMVTAPASMLESFKLSDMSSYYDEPEPVNLALPAPGVPRLRNLEIDGFPFAWDHPLFCSTLTTLVIYGRILSGPLGLFETFVSALERMTNLQELELEHVIPQAPSGPPSRKVTLPHLSSLRILASNAECRALLLHLTLPPDVRYYISDTRGAQDPADLFIALQNHLTSSSPMRTACFDEWGEHVSLYGWRAALKHTTYPNPRQPDSGTEPPDLQLEIVTRGPSSAPLRTSTIFKAVTYLDCRLDTVEGPLYHWRWMDVFAGMPNIRHLSVSRNQTTEFLEALSHTDGDDPLTLALPHLEVLKLTSVRLHSRKYSWPPELLDVMVDALIKRCHYGSPVQVLHINYCPNTCQKDVQRLAEIVPETHGDGTCPVDEDEYFEESIEGDSEEEEVADYDFDYGYDIEAYELEADPGDLMFDGDLLFGWH